MKSETSYIIPEWSSRPLLYRGTKRCLDLFIAGLVLFSGFPFWILLLVMQKLIQKEVFFYQERPGLNEVPFTVYKLKTMRDGPGDDVSRLTSWGNFLRKTSLDEFPQLINVIKGEMSLVGPRPLLTEYLDRYTTTQKLRHKVKPGLNCLAQLSGRNNISWEKQFELDLKYAEKAGFLLDFYLTLMIPVAMLKVKLTTGRKKF